MARSTFMNPLTKGRTPIRTSTTRPTAGSGYRLLGFGAGVLGPISACMGLDSSFGTPTRASTVVLGLGTGPRFSTAGGDTAAGVVGGIGVVAIKTVGGGPVGTKEGASAAAGLTTRVSLPASMRGVAAFTGARHRVVIRAVASDVAGAVLAGAVVVATIADR
jgi:hypothetical protein